VANAGIGPVSLLDDVRVGDWEDMIDVNVKGVLYGIAAALPVFRKQGFGHFVHVASTAHSRSLPIAAAHSGTPIADIEAGWAEAIEPCSLDVRS
jgi:NADP-dependent 3-hydroxy acid dehydrogenase YdfG